MAFPLLSSPLCLGSVELRNRIVQPAHFTGMATPEGTPGEQLRAYYRERARGGVAMIVSEATSVHPTSVLGLALTTQRLYEPAVVDAYRALVPELHDLGTRFVVQLWHCGVESVSDGVSWGPSGVASPTLGSDIAHAMTTAEIRELVDAYGAAATNGVAGGVDGFELQIGHGYLLHQFLSPRQNKRQDEYGGSLENRMRIVLEAYRAVREAAAEKLVGIRLTAAEAQPDGFTLDEMIDVVRRIAAEGPLAYVSVSFGNYNDQVTLLSPMGTPHGHLAHYAGAFREANPGIPVIAVGRITTPALAEQVMAQGQADLIGVVRGHIADPEFVRKALAGRADEIRPCVGANFCVSRVLASRHVSCVYNPAAGRERELGIGTLQPADEPRRVLVVGGGPAGLETARLAALRGHEVTLHEQREELGGQLVLACRPKARRELQLLVDHLVREVERHGVTVEPGALVDADTVARIDPDVVVVATGSQARANGFNASRGHLPGIPGVETARALTARDVLAGADVGTHVLLVDSAAHVEGLATLEHLLEGGKQVELVTPFATAGGKVGGTMLSRMTEAVVAKGARLTTSSFVNRIEGATVYLDEGVSRRETRRDGIDTIVVVGDLVADDALLLELLGLQLRAEIVGVGDCVAPRYLDAAILDGHRAGRAL